MKRKRIAQVFIYLALLIGAVVFILPYVYMLITSTQTNAEIFAPKLNFKPGSHFIDNITYVQETYNYTRILINSIFITVTGTLLSTFMTTLAGYVMAKFKFKGQKLIFNLIVVARMVPSFTLLIPTFYILSKLGLTNTHTGVIVSSLASTTSVFMMRQYAQKFPTELLESGRIDGANEWTIFFRIAVPVLVPSIVTVGLMNFMGYWNSYLYPLVILKDSTKFTVPLVVQNMTQNNYDVLNYGSLMAILSTSVIPVIAVYVLLQRKFKANNLDSAIK